ncbi:transposase [Nocardia suismassiliense]|uniref:transposase n=1 Tax=Nocardia suismassiliense TaxID=2077092 RepID=UPI00131F2828|nr:transposase [Nocardia suismassiliense]
MSRPTKYPRAQRDWALRTYRDTRDQYRSRMQCCAAIATALGAHVNTVLRWASEEFGPSRTLSAEELPSYVHTLQSEITRLRQANCALSEQVRARR